MVISYVDGEERYIEKSFSRFLLVIAAALKLSRALLFRMKYVIITRIAVTQPSFSLVDGI